ncbi:hypothetical protein [Flavobacterium flavigenum]|uniref:hypothetical protein n=1 Tax=Flavobacterium flavigenum TaxID=3003258 RepID=UPI0022AC8C87|nr:hypothetical protein [Flavobacterium flavigenum]
MNLYHLYGTKMFFDVVETPLNQRLLKINSKTLDNACLTIVYLHTIYNFRYKI